MSSAKRWFLPDGVDEVLPPKARRVEQLRRKLLDVCELWGYQLVMPPVIEYLDSLLSGIGEDLELQTFKLIDQVSGRLMGVRADITPQIARIDAHRMTTELPQRFCYVGPVLHTLPDKFAGSRNPLQIGAELYGHGGIDSDAEIIALLLELLKVAGIGDITVEFGHMGLFHAICDSAQLEHEFESRVLERLLMKDRSGLAADLALAGASADVNRHLMALIELNGDAEVLSQARTSLAKAPAAVVGALDEVERLIELMRARVPGIKVHLDFAELRGYHYHTGIMFAVYTPDIGRAIAWGGRYDNIGKFFGSQRSATGFSTDLKVLESLSDSEPAQLVKIFAPAGADLDLLNAIRTHRAAGYIVVQGLPGQTGSAAAMGCDKRLSKVAGSWQIEDV
jgi:ATP phosphoribosyltransferase regulatory subunit